MNRALREHISIAPFSAHDIWDTLKEDKLANHWRDGTTISVPVCWDINRVMIDLIGFRRRLSGMVINHEKDFLLASYDTVTFKGIPMIFRVGGGIVEDGGFMVPSPGDQIVRVNQQYAELDFAELVRRYRP